MLRLFLMLHICGHVVKCSKTKIILMHKTQMGKNKTLNIIKNEASFIRKEENKQETEINNGCFGSGQEVLVLNKNGVTLIENLNIGDIVWDGNQWTKVLWKRKYKKKTKLLSFEYNFKYGTNKLAITPNHYVILTNNTKFTAKGLLRLIDEYKFISKRYKYVGFIINFYVEVVTESGEIAINGIPVPVFANGKWKESYQMMGYKLLYKLTRILSYQKLLYYHDLWRNMF